MTQERERQRGRQATTDLDRRELTEAELAQVAATGGSTITIIVTS